MSLRELPAYAKRAIIRNAAENDAEYAELDGTFYLSALLGACTTAPDSGYWYGKLVDTIRNRKLLLPGEDYIPGGYESRAAADISVETKDNNIEWFLNRLVPDDGIPAAKVKYNPGTGEWVAEIRIAS